MTPDRDHPQIIAQDGDLLLIDTGVQVSGRNPPLTAGRVYDHTLGTLQPQHGPPLPVDSYLAHGEWLPITADDDERAQIRSLVHDLLAAEHD